jgi:RimJ/RimL family protein N-acetyltransferase
MQELSTSRLRLEPLAVPHARELFDGLKAPEIYTYIDEPPPRDLVSLERRYRALSGRKSPDGTEAWLNWAVYSTEFGRFIGYVQATVAQNKSAEIAAVLFPLAWGRGYAQEAVVAMLTWLASQLQVSRVSARAHPGNSRSINLLRRLGFVQEAKSGGLPAVAPTEVVFTKQLRLGGS